MKKKREFLSKITRKKISISISQKSLNKLEELNISNKSAFINWLLEQHYGLNSNNKSDE